MPLSVICGFSFAGFFKQVANILPSPLRTYTQVMCRLDLCVVLLVLTQARINKKRNYLNTFTCNQVSAIHDSDRHSRPKRSKTIAHAENDGIELIECLRMVGLKIECHDF